MHRFLYTLLVFVLVQLPLFSADYFWVGGSGDWSDLSHWATTSGGTVFHTSVPGAGDNVFFDANSFTAPGQVVTVSAPAIFCENLDWSAVTNMPVFEAVTSTELNVFGSLTLSPDMMIDLKGNVMFKGANGNHTINMAGHSFPQVVEFEGTNTTWTLDAALATDSLLLFQAGTFQANGQNINAGFLSVQPQMATTLDLTNSAVTLSGNARRSTTDPVNNYPTLYINNTAQVTTVTTGSVLELTGTVPDIWIEGGTNIDFNVLRFSNGMGEALLTGGNQGNPVAPVQMNITNLELSGSARLEQLMNIGILILSPGKDYRFLSGVTHDIVTLQAFGNCDAPILMRSNQTGNQAVLAIANPTALDFVSVQDLIAAGTGPYDINDGTDLGNSSGWTFVGGLVTTLYWVGGTGNWNDPAHWSSASGGAGGFCIPTGNTDVIFDANSFTAPGQQVSLNIDAAVCRTMAWGSLAFDPIFFGEADQELWIAGSISLDPAIDWQMQGVVRFIGNDMLNNIASLGKTFLNDIYLDAVGGNWQLVDDLSIEGVLHLVNGGFNAPNQTVSFREFNANYPGSRFLGMGNSQFMLTANAAPARWQVNAVDFAVDPGGSLIESLNNQLLVEHYGNSSVRYNELTSHGNTVMTNYGTGTDVRFVVVSLLNNGQINSSFEINKLLLSTGYTYEFGAGANQTINTLDAMGQCEGSITIRSSVVNESSFFTSTQDQEILNVNLQDMTAQGGGNFVALSAADLGNNAGWNFTDRPGRTLFWVGGSGDWYEEIHWSLSSGGPGGECVPTPIDDVFFDANSFNAPGQMVTNSLPDAFFRNMDWTGVTDMPTADLDQANCYGSMILTDQAQIETSITYFFGDGTHEWWPYGQTFNEVQFLGSGSMTQRNGFDDPGAVWYFHNGTFFTDGQPITAGTIQLDSASMGLTNTINLEDAYITLSNPVALYVTENNATTLNPGSSVIEVTDPAGLFDIRAAQTFNNVVFASTSGENEIQAFFNSQPTFNSVNFRSDGRIRGEITTDSLLLAPGYSYTFQEGDQLNINEYLLALGNNCLVIEIQSSVPGGLSEVVMPASAEIDMDFVQMADQQAVGGANFFAGNNSTDVAMSNQGWTFGVPDPLSSVGFLGEDQILCSDPGSIRLNAYSNSNGEMYTWSDGSVADSLIVTMPGTYFVEVMFPAANCMIRDTVVIEPQAFDLALPNDTTFCDQTDFTLDVGVANTDVTYQWQDMSTNGSFLASATGTYSVEVQQANCVERDTVALNFFTTPVFSLGADTTICDGSALVVDQPMTGAMSFEWFDGTSTPTVTLASTGVVWGEAANGDCVFRDSLLAEITDLSAVDLGMDSLLCDGESLLLNAGTGANYEWQDGSTQETFNAQASGEYFVVASLNSCSTSDTINLTFNPVPTFDLGADANLCDGEMASVDGTSLAGTTYEWQDDNSTNPIRDFNTAGTYILAASLNNCDFQDTIVVTVTATPVVDLGLDTTLCDGEDLTLDAMGNPGATYSWQDASDMSTLAVSGTGTYFVGVTENGCTGRDTIEVTFNPLPSFDLGADAELCDGEMASVDGTSLAGTTYEWQDNNSTNPIRDFNTAGTYILAASLNNCDFQDTIVVTVNPITPVDLGPDFGLCEGETETLIGGTAASYLWSTGSTQTTLDISAPGTYSLTLTNNDCPGVDTIIVSALSSPVVDLGVDTTLCDGENLTLDAMGNPGATYSWQDASVQPSFTVNGAGTYFVGVTENGCTGRDTIEVTYSPVPTFDLGADADLCDGELASVDGTSLAGTTYEWEDNNSTNPIRDLGTAGTYILAASLNNCDFRDTIMVSVRPTPVVDLGADATLCDGENLTLDATGNPGATYSWQDASSLSSFTVSGAGTYFVGVTEDGCTGRDTVEVTYNPLPVFDLGGDANLCDGETASVDGTSLAGTTYQWQDNNSTDPIRDFNTAGTYILATSLNNCDFRDSIVVTVAPNPLVDLGEDRRLCEGDTEILDVTQAGGLYFWSDNSTDGQLSVTTSGSYSVEVDLAGCTVADTVVLEFVAPPVFSLGSDTVLCERESIQLTAPATTGSFQWIDGSDKPELLVTNTGLYWLEVTEGCTVRDSILITFEECRPFTAFIPNVFSPNDDGVNDVFSPFFPIGNEVVEFELQVYDRWGGLVFESQNPQEGWDGKKQGDLMQPGVYVWRMYIRYVDDYGPGETEESGGVTLLR